MAGGWEPEDSTNSIPASPLNIFISTFTIFAPVPGFSYDLHLPCVERLQASTSQWALYWSLCSPITHYINSCGGKVGRPPNQRAGGLIYESSSQRRVNADVATSAAWMCEWVNVLWVAQATTKPLYTCEPILPFTTFSDSQCWPPLWCSVAIVTLCESHPVCFAAAIRGMCMKASLLNGLAVRNVYMQQHPSWGFCGRVGRRGFGCWVRARFLPLSICVLCRIFQKHWLEMTGVSAPPRYESQSQSVLHIDNPILVWQLIVCFEGMRPNRTKKDALSAYSTRAKGSGCSRAS